MHVKQLNAKWIGSILVLLVLMLLGGFPNSGTNYSLSVKDGPLDDMVEHFCSKVTGENCPKLGQAALTACLSVVEIQFHTEEGAREQGHRLGYCMAKLYLQLQEFQMDTQEDSQLESQ